MKSPYTTHVIRIEDANRNIILSLEWKPLEFNGNIPSKYYTEENEQLGLYACSRHGSSKGLREDKETTLRARLNDLYRGGNLEKLLKQNNVKYKWENNNE